MSIEITRMTSKGQVVIPQEIRQKKKLKEGEKFIVYDTEDSIILKRADSVEEFEKTFRSIWEKIAHLGINDKDIVEAIAEVRRKKRHVAGNL